VSDQLSFQEPDARSTRVPLGDALKVDLRETVEIGDLSFRVGPEPMDRALSDALTQAQKEEATPSPGANIEAADDTGTDWLKNEIPRQPEVTVGMQSKNPLNIKARAGLVGPRPIGVVAMKYGKQAVYADAADGYEAALRLAMRPYHANNDTVEKFVMGWYGGNKEENPKWKENIAAIAQELGVRPDQPLGLRKDGKPTKQMLRLMAVLSRYESGYFDPKALEEASKRLGVMP
jgi:hypothetical protein